MTSGSDKSSRQAEKQRAAAQVPPLNPPFPFKAVAFDAAFFGVDRNAADQIEKP